MRRCFATLAALVMGFLALGGVAHASPPDDLKAFRNYYKQLFPEVPPEDFVNGSSAINEGLRSQWESLMQFPPYSFALARGKELFNTPFENGKSYADCFPNDGIGIKQNYPYFDTKTNEVITLELTINRCRVKNGEEPLPYETGDIAAISAYMADTSRGKPFDIKTPDDPAELAAYRAGKEFFYSRKGQLNFSCASCHVQNPGKRLRTQLLAPAMGSVAAFPIHRSEWGEMGTLHRRFTTCLANVRAEPPPPQSEALRNLEYFLTYMSNGLPVAGPGARP